MSRLNKVRSFQKMKNGFPIKYAYLKPVPSYWTCVSQPYDGTAWAGIQNPGSGCRQVHNAFYLSQQSKTVLMRVECHILREQGEAGEFLGM